MPSKIFFSHSFLSTVFAIVSTGALLNLASKGTFGDTAKDFASFVIKGYGAGAI